MNEKQEAAPSAELYVSWGTGTGGQIKIRRWSAFASLDGATRYIRADRVEAMEALLIRLHEEGALSEGQVAKATGLDRVTVRKMADDHRNALPDIQARRLADLRKQRLDRSMHHPLCSVHKGGHCDYDCPRDYTPPTEDLKHEGAP